MTDLTDELRAIAGGHRRLRSNAADEIDRLLAVLQRVHDDYETSYGVGHCPGYVTEALGSVSAPEEEG